MSNEIENQQTILIVEDEPELAELLKEYLEASNFSAFIINNGLEAEQWLAEHTPSLILLDLMLPGKNGLDLCRSYREKSDTPIIMVTAKVEEIDRLLGLELGADDYICKPYSPREVIARVKAVLRRTESSGAPAATSKGIVLDQDRQQVSIDGNNIELTTIEFRLFELLHSDPGKIYSRQYILDNIYTDYRIVSDRTVDSHIKKLRKKLQVALPEIDLIRSVYGAGYKFEPPA